MSRKHLVFGSLYSSTSEPNRLIRSFIGNHGPVSSSTIARWLKAGLQSVGVYETRFQAYFVRAATTSKAFLSGLTVEDILKAADWLSHAQGVFQKFYYKPKHSLAFGSTVLADTVTSTKSHVDMETKPSEA